MALEQFRLKPKKELAQIFEAQQEKENQFIADGLVYEQLLIGNPSVIPIFSCYKCLVSPSLAREASDSTKTKNKEHKKYRWRYSCQNCGHTTQSHSKSIVLAKLDWNFANYAIWSSDRISVFDLKNLTLEEKKAKLHFIRTVLECRVKKLEVEYFLTYAKGPDQERLRQLEKIEHYKLFMHWQIVAQRIVAHEINQQELKLTNGSY